VTSGRDNPDNGEQALREDARAMFAAAVAAGDPQRLTAQLLRATSPLFDGGELLVAAAGKAAVAMAAAAEAVLGDRIRAGIAIAPQPSRFDLEHVRIAVARHPLPDERGEWAAGEICRMLAAHPDLPLLCLLSGGASSLLVCPRPPVSLADKIAVTDLLLRSGADIHAVNAVRKHLSLVKGGGLLRQGGPRSVLTLMMSDVLGDDPSVIGSGPTVADPSTYADAEGVLRDHGIFDLVPASVRRVVAEGVAGNLPETVKPGAPELAASRGVVIANNRTALEGAAAEARRRGYFVTIDDEAVVGDTTAAAHRWWQRIEGLVAAAPRGRRRCVIAGGETTVRVRGAGRGGRNQEFALALVEDLRGCAWEILSAGTDGVDGPTDAAGAFLTGSSAARGESLGLDAAGALAANDSYSYFAALGDLHRSGATGTNLMDIKIAVAPPR